MSMPPPPDLIVEAFGLGSAISQLESRHSSQENWRLSTTSGPVMVKRFWEGTDPPWRRDLEAAMELEQLAFRAGIAIPAPIRPRRPVFGVAARIEGYGVFRVSRFVEHRPLEPSDDIASWLGTSLACIHSLRPLAETPAPNWWYGQVPPGPPERWETWLEEGSTQKRVWAPALRERLSLIVDLSVRVVDTFRSCGPHVLTHRDLEPPNVLITPAGPVIIDWDTAGPDSAPLEAAYVMTAFARHGRDSPNRDMLSHTHRAYLDAGGPQIPSRADLLARHVGGELAFLSDQIAATLRGEHYRRIDPRQTDLKVRNGLDRLPQRVKQTAAWAGLFTTT